jgi:ribosome biogenesis GTPase
LKNRPAQAPAGPAPGLAGLVIASFGRHVLVESCDGQRRLCHPRGKKNQAVVGDQVLWLPSEDEGTIEQVQQRRNLFYRQDELRTKSFAANLDQVLIFLAAEPEFSESQLTRALVAAEAERIRPLIALNKSDLSQPFERAWARLAPYREMGYEVLPLAVKPDADAGQEALADLPERLHSRTTLVLGPSGAGKSSLVNRLVPTARVLTAEISQALNSGKHTTTSTTLYWMDADRTSALIDSPGFQEFGLRHIPAMDLAQLMPDVRAHAQECRFHNCTHLHEPGCGVITQTQASDQPSRISAQRYRLYRELFEELCQPPRY